MVLLSNIAFSIIEDNPIVFDTTYSSNFYDGMQILVLDSDIILVNITKDNLSNAVDCIIFNDTGVNADPTTDTPLFNGTFTGDVCTPNINLTSGKKYSIFAYGNSVDSRYKNGAGLGYPKAGTFINWTAGRQDSSNFSNWAYNIDKIGVIEIQENFSITSKSFWDNTTINIFNATINGMNYGTSIGNIITNISRNSTSLFNITVYSSVHFNSTFIDYNVSSDLEASLKQSEINLSIKNLFTNISVNNISVFLNGSLVFNISDSSKIIYPDADDYKVTSIIDNTNGEEFDINNSDFSVSALDNKTIEIYITQYIINITAKDINDGSTINTFTVNVTNLNISETTSYNTSNGFIEVLAIDGVYDIVLISATGYSVLNGSGEYYARNDSLIINDDVNISYELYTTNSINFFFKDADTLNLLNNTNVTITFVGANSFSNTTSNGTIYIDLITPSDYTVTVSADNYRQTQYFITVTNETFQNITILMQKSNNSELVLITVNDKFSGAPIKNSKVTIQKFVNNGWITDQILQTDFQGRTEGHFVLSTVFYNFLVEFENQTFFGVINSNADKKLIFAEDVNNGIIIEIDTDPNDAIDTYQGIYDIDTNLSFTNLSNTTGRFRYGFINNNGVDTIGQLIVYKDGVLVCSQSVTSSTGTLFCNVNVTGNTTSVFTGLGYINGELIDALIHRIDDSNKFIDWGVFGFFIALFITMFTVFIFAKIPSLSVIIGYASVASLIFLSVLFKNISLNMWVILIVIAFIILRIPKKVSV